MGIVEYIEIFSNVIKQYSPLHLNFPLCRLKIHSALFCLTAVLKYNNSFINYQTNNAEYFLIRFRHKTLKIYALPKVVK